MSWTQASAGNSAKHRFISYESLCKIAVMRPSILTFGCMVPYVPAGLRARNGVLRRYNRRTRMSRRKIATTVYITKEQDQALKLLAERTDTSVAQYIREGIDLVLEKHRAEMPRQLSLMGDES